MEIRQLVLDDPADVAASRALGEEAFAPYPGPPPPVPASPPPGRHVWGSFDGGRLVAKVAAHEYESWWHGVALPTCGVAGVAVAAEHRGSGLLGPLLERVLAQARGRGDVLSTLYPTATGIYRSMGYELVTSLDVVEVPTAELARTAAPRDTTTRRAEPGDLAAVRETYATWAAAQNGPLTRTGPLFSATDEEVLAEATYTLAIDRGDRVVGYLSWVREEGYGPQGRLRVLDLVALTGDAYRALWRVAGSFASVAGTVRLRTSGDDPARLALPTSTWDVVERNPYMLRVLDVSRALDALGLALPGGGAVSAAFAVRGDRFDVLDGGYTVSIGDAPADPHPIERAPQYATFTPQGLALAFAGVQSCANLRLLEHLSGPHDVDDVLDALLGGRQVHVRDYF